MCVWFNLKSSLPWDSSYQGFLAELFAYCFSFFNHIFPNLASLSLSYALNLIAKKVLMALLAYQKKKKIHCSASSVPFLGGSNRSGYGKVIPKGLQKSYANSWNPGKYKKKASMTNRDQKFHSLLRGGLRGSPGWAPLLPCVSAKENAGYSLMQTCVPEGMLHSSSGSKLQ